MTGDGVYDMIPAFKHFQNIVVSDNVVRRNSKTGIEGAYFLRCTGNVISENETGFKSSDGGSGTFSGNYIKPRSVVYSEIKTKTREEIDAAYNLYLSLNDFDFVLNQN